MRKEPVSDRFLDTIREVSGRMIYAKKIGIPLEDLNIRNKVLAEALIDLIDEAIEFVEGIQDEKS